MKIVNEILNELLKAAELDSPEWDRIVEALDEVSGLQRHLEAVKKQQEATSKALYHLQFDTHEKLIERYIKLRDFVVDSGLEIPPHIQN